MSTQSGLLNLPRDAQVQLLQHLDPRDWLSLALSCKHLAQLVKDDELWKALALKTWGPAVETLSVSPQTTWHAYCRHRLPCVGSPPSSTVSPLNLIQELYPDPFRLIASCIMCSRTSGGSIVRDVVAAVFATWPTPSELMAARESELAAVIYPLGLPAVRVRALRELSRDFLVLNWEDPSAFYGCGRFVSDSWRIFCRGHRSVHDVDDVNLKRYLRWLTKEPQEEDGQQQQARFEREVEIPSKRAERAMARGVRVKPDHRGKNKARDREHAREMRGTRSRNIQTGRVRS
jgi:hypothetical protein